jgi:hypothetical protein
MDRKSGLSRSGARVAWLMSAAVIVGCGGDGGPSAAERQAGLGRWADRVDSICEATGRAIAMRGAPTDMLDIERVAVRAEADVRGAVERIRGVRAPSGTESRVRLVLAELDRVQRDLAALTKASKVADMDGLLRAATLLAEAGEGLRRRAEPVGLGQCGRGDVPVKVSDAILAPVFATQVAQFDRWLRQSGDRLAQEQPESQSEFADRYVRSAELMAEARARWQALAPPARTQEAAFAYEHELVKLQDLASEIAEELGEGRRITLTWARSVKRRVAAADRRERAALRRLMREIGAQPIAAPP